MEEQLKEVEERKKRFSSWIKDKHNFYFLLIILFAFIVRIYYFILTKSQPLWWDEADYMAFAKAIAGINNHWIISVQHISIFPYLTSLFFKIGIFSEPIMRFILEFVPSILIIILTYKILILMYNDKRIALISTFLISVFWEFMFDSFRFQTDIPALLFALLSVYVFFKGYERKEKIFSKINHNWAVPLAVIMLIISYSIRRAYIIFGIFFLLYILLTTKFKDIIKNKYNWIALFIGIALLFLVEEFIFSASLIKVTGTYLASEAPFTLLPLQIFNVYFSNINNPLLSPLVYLLYLGSLVLLANLILNLGYFKKPENQEIRSSLFMAITMIITLSYFLLWQRRADNNIGDPRWYFPLLLGSLVAISKGTLFITDYVKKYSKIISAILLILLIGFGGYYELAHADMIIKVKLPSYQGIKDASLYIKQVSNPTDIIVGVPNSQPAYYAERQVIQPAQLTNNIYVENVTFNDFLSKIYENKNIRYVLVSFSEPNHPLFMRQEEYYQNPQTGQVSYSKWIIPFAASTIDFVNNVQDIKPEIDYKDQKVGFKLLKVFNEVFVYEVIHL